MISNHHKGAGREHNSSSLTPIPIPRGFCYARKRPRVVLEPSGRQPHASSPPSSASPNTARRRQPRSSTPHYVRVLHSLLSTLCSRALLCLCFRISRRQGSEMFHWLAKMLCTPVQWKRSTRAGTPNISRAAGPTSASTQVAPESSSVPWLPPELVSLILSNIWEASQTLQERSAFVKNATLVNRTWLALVAFITSRDVHIHTGEDGSAFTRRLSKHPGEVADLFTAEKIRVTNNVCRSITFHVDGTLTYAPSGALVPVDSLHLPSWSPPADRMCSTIGFFLYNVAKPGDRYWQTTLPQLRHIALRYTHWTYDDTFKHLEQGPFPPQVTRLSIHHAFPDPSFKETMCERWLQTREGTHTRYAPPSCHCDGRLCECGRDRRRGRHYQDVSNVRHLSLSGTTSPFAIAVLRSCRGIETLELELEPEPEPARRGNWEPARLDTIAPLPPRTRTVVLRHPGPGAVDGKEIRRWMVCEAVRIRLFPPEVPVPQRATGTGTARSSRRMHCDLNANTTGRRRIVVRSGAPDPAVFETARRECERFGVALVHESPDGPPVMSGRRSRAKGKGFRLVGRRSGDVLSCIRRGVRGCSGWEVAWWCGTLLAAVLIVGSVSVGIYACVRDRDKGFDEDA